MTDFEKAIYKTRDTGIGNGMEMEWNIHGDSEESLSGFWGLVESSRRF